MEGAATGTSKKRLPVSILMFVMLVENALAFPYVRTVLIQNGYPGVLMANTYRRPRTKCDGLVRNTVNQVSRRKQVENVEGVLQWNLW